MQIDLNRCIGCGACTKDCQRMLLQIKDGKVAERKGICLECGHCVSICPTGALRLDGGDESEIIEYQPEHFDIAPSTLLNMMKFRRSVRHFTHEPVEDDQLNQMLEAARYAPTGSNNQDTRYIVLRSSKEWFTRRALEVLHNTAVHLDDYPELKWLSRYREKWERIYYDYIDRGKDNLFYNAPCIVLVVAPDLNGGAGQLNAGLASDNIELMAHSLRLGACYIGFFSFAVTLDDELAEVLGLSENEKLVSTLAIGHPAVKYYRTVNRKKANVTLL